MTEQTTTLGAPLSPEEYEKMQMAFIFARRWMNATSHEQRPEEFLGIATKMIDFGFKLRDAVQHGFNAANDRAFRSSTRTPLHKAVAKTVPTTFTFSAADLEAALQAVKESK